MMKIDLAGEVLQPLWRKACASKHVCKVRSTCLAWVLVGNFEKRLEGSRETQRPRLLALRTAQLRLALPLDTTGTRQGRALQERGRSRSWRPSLWWRPPTAALLAGPRGLPLAGYGR